MFEVSLFSGFEALQLLLQGKSSQSTQIETVVDLNPKMHLAAHLERHLFALTAAAKPSVFLDQFCNPFRVVERLNMVERL